MGTVLGKVFYLERIASAYCAELPYGINGHWQELLEFSEAIVVHCFSSQRS